MNIELSEKLSLLKKDKVFFGTVGHIEKLDHKYVISVDLYNNTTKDIDELFFTGTIKNLTYLLELEIETPNLTMLAHKDELFEIQIVKKNTQGINIFDGVLKLTTNLAYDKVNPFRGKKVRVKIAKASINEKNEYKELYNKHVKSLKKLLHIEEKLEIKPKKRKRFSTNVGVLYSQYYVGKGNCSYINLGGLSKGFFNIGFIKEKKSKVSQYNGFSRHKPNWIILSNLNKYNYNGAVRYGNHNLFSCDWIMPTVAEYNINLIRLFYCILNSGGNIYMLKYKANSSVVSLIRDQVKMEVYYTSDNDLDYNGLSLYVEYQDKYILFGNSDYNFMTKSLVNQKFDMIVVPYKGSKWKAKISLQKYDIAQDTSNRNGFKVHRTDKSGTFVCQL